jgi:NitT/TauT family transport system permease protein
MSQPPYIRPEFERELAPLRDLPVETPLPLGQRLWHQTWLRKSLILLLVLALWELAARVTQNDLMLPGVAQTLRWQRICATASYRRRSSTLLVRC